MAESKIEKQEPGLGFELLYEKAVQKINETNIPTTVLSGEFKKKFLNFYNLSHNEQLELVSDLSKIEGLPQEMTDALSQFPYLHTIPKDIGQEINSYLKKPDTSALIRTDKRQHALFQPDRLLPIFLLKVATGKQDEAEKMVAHLELQLKSGTVTDYSGRTFKNITAYEYAYWAKDTHMCRMLEKHMNAETKAAMLKRCEAIEKNGLTYVQHGVEVTGSKHFDFTPLKTALKNYIEGFRNWHRAKDWMATVNAWGALEKAQRDVPVHVANEYCRKDRSFVPKPTFKENTLPRELAISIYNAHDLIISHGDAQIRNQSWFSAGSGVTLSIVRGGHFEARAEGCYVDYDCASALMLKLAGLDLEAIDHLDTVRTDELTQSRANLMQAEPHLANNGFHCA